MKYIFLTCSFGLYAVTGFERLHLLHFVLHYLFIYFINVYSDWQN